MHDPLPLAQELELLEKLYTLYITVIQKVNGYADLLWTELDFQSITDEVCPVPRDRGASGTWGTGRVWVSAKAETDNRPQATMDRT